MTQFELQSRYIGVQLRVGRVCLLGRVEWVGVGVGRVGGRRGGAGAVKARRAIRRRCRGAEFRTCRSHHLP